MPTGESGKEWVVRVERRDNGKLYFYDYHGNINARRSSSMRFDKETAKQLSHAIATQHKDFTARAMRFDSPVHSLPKDE